MVLGVQRLEPNDGLTLLSLAAARRDGTSYSMVYLYTADERPYAAIYRSGETSVPFTLVTTDRGDVVGLLDAAGAPFASYRYDQWGRPWIQRMGLG